MLRIIIICNIILKCLCINKTSEITGCYENSSNSSTPLQNIPMILDVTLGSSVHLLCQFCQEKENCNPKLWFYKPRGITPFKEVVAAIERNDTVNKLSVTPFHKLNIENFVNNNSGIYICKSPISEKENAFIYILEGVFHNVVDPKVGSNSQWQEYKRNNLDKINKLFKVSDGEPYKSLGKNNNLTFELVTVWENWGECKEIEHQKGVRKRIGRCRLMPSTGNITEKNFQLITNSKQLAYLTDGFNIPCRSILLNETAPEISQLVRNIPDFEAEETCRVSKRTIKHRAIKEKAKHRTAIRAIENSHVTLACTEADPYSILKWYKDEKLLNFYFRNSLLKYEEEPHIMSVDTNNSLHILHVTKNQEGNYSCVGNGKKLQEFEVTVVSKRKLLNQEFIRYSIYLGFVLSLTMTCYCAGVFVAWHRRSSFADPLDLNKEGNYDNNPETQKLLK